MEYSLIILGRIARAVDHFNRLLGRLAYILLVVESGFIVVAIFLRYVLNSPFAAAVEIEQIIMVFIAFFGCSYVLIKRGHIRVELFIDMLKPKTRDLITGINYLAFGIPYCVLLLYFCFSFVQSSYIMNEHSQGSMILLWPIKSVLLLGFLLLALQFLISGIKFIYRGTQREAFIDKKSEDD